MDAAEEMLDRLFDKVQQDGIFNDRGCSDSDEDDSDNDTNGKNSYDSSRNGEKSASHSSDSRSFPKGYLSPSKAGGVIFGSSDIQLREPELRLTPIDASNFLSMKSVRSDLMKSSRLDDKATASSEKSLPKQQAVSSNTAPTARNLFEMPNMPVRSRTRGSGFGVRPEIKPTKAVQRRAAPKSVTVNPKQEKPSNKSVNEKSEDKSAGSIPSNTALSKGEKISNSSDRTDSSVSSSRADNVSELLTRGRKNSLPVFPFKVSETKESVKPKSGSIGLRSSTKEDSSVSSSLPDSVPNLPARGRRDTVQVVSAKLPETKEVKTKSGSIATRSSVKELPEMKDSVKKPTGGIGTRSTMKEGTSVSSNRANVSEILTRGRKDSVKFVRENKATTEKKSEKVEAKLPTKESKVTPQSKSDKPVIVPVRRLCVKCIRDMPKSSVNDVAVVTNENCETCKVTKKSEIQTSTSEGPKEKSEAETTAVEVPKTKSEVKSSTNEVPENKSEMKTTTNEVAKTKPEKTSTSEAEPASDAKVVDHVIDDIASHYSKTSNSAPSDRATSELIIQECLQKVAHATTTATCTTSVEGNVIIVKSNTGTSTTKSVLSKTNSIIIKDQATKAAIRSASKNLKPSGMTTLDGKLYKVIFLPKASSTGITSTTPSTVVSSKTTVKPVQTASVGSSNVVASAADSTSSSLPALVSSISSPCVVSPAESTDVKKADPKPPTQPQAPVKPVVSPAISTTSAEPMDSKLAPKLKKILPKQPKLPTVGVATLLNRTVSSPAKTASSPVKAITPEPMDFMDDMYADDMYEVNDMNDEHDTVNTDAKISSPEPDVIPTSSVESSTASRSIISAAKFTVPTTSLQSSVPANTIPAPATVPSVAPQKINPIASVLPTFMAPFPPKTTYQPPNTGTVPAPHVLPVPGLYVPKGATVPVSHVLVSPSSINASNVVTFKATPVTSLQSSFTAVTSPTTSYLVPISQLPKAPLSTLSKKPSLLAVKVEPNKFKAKEEKTSVLKNIVTKRINVEALTSPSSTSPESTRFITLQDYMAQKKPQSETRAIVSSTNSASMFGDIQISSNFDSTKVPLPTVNKPPLPASLKSGVSVSSDGVKVVTMTTHARRPRIAPADELSGFKDNFLDMDLKKSIVDAVLLPPFTPSVPDSVYDTYNPNAKFKCPQCPDMFITANHLQNHLNRRSALMKYECPSCPNNLIVIYNRCMLKHHCQKHSAEVNYRYLTIEPLPLALFDLSVFDSAKILEPAAPTPPSNVSPKVPPVAIPAVVPAAVPAGVKPKVTGKKPPNTKPQAKIQKSSTISPVEELDLPLIPDTRDDPILPALAQDWDAVNSGADYNADDDILLLKKSEKKSDKSKSDKSKAEKSKTEKKNKKPSGREKSQEDNIVIPGADDVDTLTRCGECRTEFPSLHAHLQGSGKPIGAFACKCKKVCTSACSLKAHRRWHLLAAPHSCPECGAIFKSHKALEDHFKQTCYHPYKKSAFMCLKCKTNFSVLSKLESHILKTHTRQVNICGICSSSNSDSTAVAAHMRVKHPESAGLPEFRILRFMACDFCPKTKFPRHQSRQHIQAHTNQKSSFAPNYYYQCEFCKDYKTVSKLDFGQHLDYCLFSTSLRSLENEPEVCDLSFTEDEDDTQDCNACDTHSDFKAKWKSNKSKTGHNHRHKKSSTGSKAYSDLGFTDEEDVDDPGYPDDPPEYSACDTPDFKATKSKNSKIRKASSSDSRDSFDIEADVQKAVAAIASGSKSNVKANTLVPNIIDIETSSSSSNSNEIKSKVWLNGKEAVPRTVKVHFESTVKSFAPVHRTIAPKAPVVPTVPAAALKSSLVKSLPPVTAPLVPTVPSPFPKSAYEANLKAPPVSTPAEARLKAPPAVQIPKVPVVPTTIVPTVPSLYPKSFEAKSNSSPGLRTLAPKVSVEATVKLPPAVPTPSPKVISEAKSTVEIRNTALVSNFKDKSSSNNNKAPLPDSSDMKSVIPKTVLALDNKAVKAETAKPKAMEVDSSGALKETKKPDSAVSSGALKETKKPDSAVTSSSAPVKRAGISLEDHTAGEPNVFHSNLFKLFAKSAKVMQCKYCPEKFESSVEAFSHLKSVHSEVINPSALKRKNTQSPTITQSKVMKTIDSNQKTSEGSHVCSKCTFVGKTYEELYDHMETHKTVYKCSKCTESFVARPSLEKHLIFLHKLDPKSAKSIMDRDNACSEVVKENGAFHAREGFYQCATCYKNFTTEDAFNTHFRTHGLAFVTDSASPSKLIK